MFTTRLSPGLGSGRRGRRQAVFAFLGSSPTKSHTHRSKEKSTPNSEAEIEGLQELLELFGGQPRLLDDGSQRSRGDLAMIGNSDASMRMNDRWHNDVSAPLPVLLVPHLRQRRCHFAAGRLW
jgi:hypothetical protein